MREIFSPDSRRDAAFVNKAPESVTLTWIESESHSVHMTSQQELVLARYMENDNEDPHQARCRFDPDDTLLERNVYTAQVQHNVKAHRAADAFAYAPASVSTYSTQDFGIESQR